MKKLYTIIIILIFLSLPVLKAQISKNGFISGLILEKQTGKPLEFATVVLKSVDSTFVQGTTTNSTGEFSFEKVPIGSYKLIYSFIGFEKVEIILPILKRGKAKINLGKLYLSESGQTLGEVEVMARKMTFINSIDRKTFNVGSDLMSKTGSVSELFQNIPSVQVDIEGNVSLRGSENVMIFINGKPSALMGANRAAVLQQMPANSIEKIEIITNPSAKYKPDGTAGIINIVLKKEKSLGLNGSITANAGNDNRYNGSIVSNYNPGKLNFFGNYSIRQDDRQRYTKDFRKNAILNSDTILNSQLNSTDKSRPLSNIVNAGIDYKVSNHTKMGISGNYNYRSFIRYSKDVNSFENDGLHIIKDYDRSRRDPEYEKDVEMSANIQHTFAKEGHEMNFDFTSSKSREQEDNHYTNFYRTPSLASTHDNTLIKQGDDESQLSVEYVNPISEDSKFESGYIFENRKNDMDFFGESLNNPTNVWVKDVEKSNEFMYTESIHVLYGTYERDLGKFGFLVGLRAEEAILKSNQITTDTIFKNQYFRLYPSLHLSYKITDIHELQMNYSHRIRRPEGDEMNPFSEYQDPYNLRIGNPHLKPADIHSLEFGYQFKKNGITLLSTLYYRYTYNDMTDITKFINDSVKLTTRENLSKSNSAGIELVFSSNFSSWGYLNLSTNIFYNNIDATSLGYSKKKSAIAWSANLSSGINLSKSTMLQINSGYTAERLAPQGKQQPTFVVNAGFKQEFLKRKAAFILTFSDIFNSMRYTTIIDTPELFEKTIRKRSARIIYAGVNFTFGSQLKKDKNNNSIKFDNQI